MVKLVTVALLISILPIAALAAPAPALEGSPSSQRGGPRLRPYDARSASLLLQGIERSATLRAIVDELERQDVFVYIEMQPALKQPLAGTLTWLAKTAAFRYVRISINPSLGGGLAIATLGHELQHALEVARQPSIVSETSLASYYQQHGISMRSHTNGWDTIAARVVGDAVRREVAGVHGTSVAESIQAFDPD